MSKDQRTADAFANSWNHLPAGSVYTRDQFEDWMAPLTVDDFREHSVLELGCGNGSLLVHTAAWSPAHLVGVDLGSSVDTARANLQLAATQSNVKVDTEVIQSDLTTFASDGFDVVYCIGVLHHLKEPRAGFAAVVRNTKPQGRFHCWVYGREGNRVVIMFVEPIRRLASRLPWWLTKYAIATPLAVPFYLYAKVLRGIVKRRPQAMRNAPLRDYCLWIAPREFAFFRHVAFDQLVTPQTAYISREELAQWLASDPAIDASSTYIVQRNGNSWKFGGRRSAMPDAAATSPDQVVS
jgi:SAM-dependent methyltransferase